MAAVCTYSGIGTNIFMMIMTSGGLKGEGVNAIKWLGQQIMVLHVYYENQNNIGVQCCSKCD